MASCGNNQTLHTDLRVGLGFSGFVVSVSPTCSLSLYVVHVFIKILLPAPPLPH